MGKFQSPPPPFHSQQPYFSPPLRGGDQGEGESTALPPSASLSPHPGPLPPGERESKELDNWEGRKNLEVEL